MPFLPRLLAPPLDRSRPRVCCFLVSPTKRTGLAAGGPYLARSLCRTIAAGLCGAIAVVVVVAVFVDDDDGNQQAKIRHIRREHSNETSERLFLTVQANVIAA